MKHKKLIGSVVGLAVVTAGATVAAYAAESSEPSPLLGCQQSELALPDGGDLLMSMDAVSSSGEHIAGEDSVSKIAWRAGDARRMSDEIPSHQKIVGVNSSAMAVTDEGLVYQDGSLTRLDTPERAEITAVNDAGDIIGNVTRVEGEGSEAYTVSMTPLIWRDGDMRELELESGNRGEVRAITDDGTAVGFQTEKDDPDDDAGVPWVWTADGESRPLPKSGEGTQPLPVDAAGDWVLATIDAGSHGWRFPLSDPDAMEPLDKELAPELIDETGRAWGGVGLDPAYQDGGDVVRLPDDMGDGEDTAWVHDVNADGTVAVGEVGNGAQDSPVMWNCEH